MPPPPSPTPLWCGAVVKPTVVCGRALSAMMTAMLSRNRKEPVINTKNPYTIPIYIILACKTARFILRNGPFCVLKWAVLQLKMTHFVSR